MICVIDLTMFLETLIGPSVFIRQTFLLYLLLNILYIFINKSEDSLLPQALDAFTNALKINPENADAYYHRGLCNMRIQYSSVEDLDRALLINPDFFQVSATFVGIFQFQFLTTLLLINNF